MRVINDEGKTISCKEVKSLNAISEERIRILKFLGKQPAYAVEVAKEIGLPVQTTYYHIRVLEQAGLIGFVDYEEKNGGVAKRYATRSQSFALIIDDKGWKESTLPTKNIPNLLVPFVSHGFFDGLMVVGSPDPHGKHRARASELGMLELAMLIGGYAAPVFPIYKLDTQINEGDKGKNLILAGGPKVNTLVAEVNDKLPIKYARDYSEVYSTLTSKAYSGNIGIVELIKSPFAKGKYVLVVGGLNQHGTRAAVLALVKNIGEFENEDRIARVVEGFDEDGDGRVDVVEFLE
ncbi:Uncharacterised protein [Candidatus Bilamarchaeum dharawalense]|uniref:EF-hand domain-containing protein n=1 Tax=Candidatus Bilamarchaeum dharawalense TaxID=2885759 RepID=A0A5E4LM32_9ARCH|nr:Uncharacterised protein [Candidatus Bilamarchaeum dharawalense]